MLCFVPLDESEVLLRVSVYVNEKVWSYDDIIAEEENVNVFVKSAHRSGKLQIYLRLVCVNDWSVTICDIP